METAAQFITAALRTHRYTPPVDILSVETASPEALKEILSEVSFGGGGGAGQTDRQGMRGILVYCLIGLICLLFLLLLFGVLYGIMQRRAQTRDSGEPGSEYAQKDLLKKVSYLIGQKGD